MKLISLGVVSRPHGLDGSFVLATDAGTRSAIRHKPQIYLSRSAERWGPFQVTEASHMAKGWKVNVVELQSLEAISAHIGDIVQTERSVVGTQSNDFLVEDLVGMPVWQNDKMIGHVARVEPAKVGPDRWWIKLLSGDTLAIPAVTRYILSVNTQQAKVIVQNTEELP